jgi:lysophospholipase L1-like esterase
VWVQGPCARAPKPNGEPGGSEGAYSTDRIRHLNDTILPALVAERPDVELFDLFSVLCPDGEFVPEFDGIELRPDGVHFSAEGSAWVADRIGSELIRTGLG